MRLELPGPDVLAGLDAAQVSALAVPVFCLDAEVKESVQAMIVLPQPGQLVVATRQSSGRAGRTLLIQDGGAVNCAQPPAPVRDYSAVFGSPVRLLSTHPKVELPDATPDNPNDDVFIEAGRYIYGVRDEVACGGAVTCSGVLAVDTTTHQHALDISNTPMLPITAAGGIPTGMAIVPDADLRLRFDDGDRVPRIPLLGILPSSSGSITLFSGNDLRPFNLSTADATVTVEERDGQERAVDLPTTDVVLVTQESSLQRQRLYQGSVRSAAYRLIYQGALPGLAGLTRGEDPRRFEVARADADRVLAGQDIIVLESNEAECATDLRVDAVQPIPDTPRALLVINTDIPEACAGLPRFTVRAAGTQPYVLATEEGLFLSRTVTNTPYVIPTEYFFHVQDFASFPQPAPPLNILVRTRPEEARNLVRGDRFAVFVDSGIRNYVFGVNTESVNAGLDFYRLPGRVVATESNGTSLAYITYPSADGILQVNLEVIVDNIANATGLRAFE